jgi:large subunit ribosomal protein L18
VNTIHKAQLLQKRKWRIRNKIAGTAARPRLSVKFSGKHIYAQAINDDTATTVVFLSSVDPELRPQKLKANLAGAKVLGDAFAVKAKAAGLTLVVFDRNGRPPPG